MAKHTWQITLNKYDNAGVDQLYVKADSCDIYEGAIKFHIDPAKTEENPYPESVLVAFLPSDRVFEIEILDDETGEPAGFLPVEEE
jgi:hypothetical protein